MAEFVVLLLLFGIVGPPIVIASQLLAWRLPHRRFNHPLPVYERATFILLTQSAILVAGLAGGTLLLAGRRAGVVALGAAAAVQFLFLMLHARRLRSLKLPPAYRVQLRVTAFLTRVTPVFPWVLLAWLALIPLTLQIAGQPRPLALHLLSYAGLAILVGTAPDALVPPLHALHLIPAPSRAVRDAQLLFLMLPAVLLPLAALLWR